MPIRLGGHQDLYPTYSYILNGSLGEIRVDAGA